MIEIEICKECKAKLPLYATEGAAAMDLCAYLPNDENNEVILEPNTHLLIKTGIKLAIPKGYKADIKSRSGLALKYGVFVLNADGLIDSDYRGDIGVILMNLGNEPFTIKQGDRIAQMTITKYEEVNFKLVSCLSETKRGDGGFGSTGKN